VASGRRGRYWQKMHKTGWSRSLAVDGFFRQTCADQAIRPRLDLARFGRLFTGAKSRYYREIFRSRRELAMTETLLMLMAAAASMGLSRMPNTG